MIYQMQEGYLTLDGEWQDQSVNMLVAHHLTVKGANLTVTRESLPSGVGFLDYLTEQKKILAEQLTDFNQEAEVPHIIDGRAARFLEFTWNNQGNPFHQMIMIIPEKDGILSLTATVPGFMDEVSREALLNVLKSFRSGPAQAAQEGPAS